MNGTKTMKGALLLPSGYAEPCGSSGEILGNQEINMESLTGQGRLEITGLHLPTPDAS